MASTSSISVIDARVEHTKTPVALVDTILSAVNMKYLAVVVVPSAFAIADSTQNRCVRDARACADPKDYNPQCHTSNKRQPGKG